MKKMKRILSMVLAMCFVVCAFSIPASAQEKSTDSAGGPIYNYIMDNGYPAISTQDFFDCVEAVDEVVYLVTGRHFIAQEKFNIVLDEKLDELCFEVAQASGLDVTLLFHSVPEFNGLAIDITEKYNIDTPKLQKILNDLSAKYAAEENYTVSNLFRAVAIYMGIIEECYFYCEPVEGLDNTYEIYCQLTFRDGRTDYLSSGIYYNTETEMLYGKDDNGMVGIGFDFDVGNLMIFTPVHVWMRNFGFGLLYDLFSYVTPFYNYQTVRIKFEYDNAEWMIQLWKGRYFVANGGEVGVYKREIGSEGTFYNCVGDEDMLLMSLDVYHNDEQLVHRDPMYHWWMTGFGLGKTLYLPQSLLLESDITLKDAEMLKAFCTAIDNLDSDDISYKVNGLTVSIEW